MGEGAGHLNVSCLYLPKLFASVKDLNDFKFRETTMTPKDYQLVVWRDLDILDPGVV